MQEGQYLEVSDIDSQRKMLRVRQRELIKEWGESVRQGAQEWESEHAANDDADEDVAEDKPDSAPDAQDKGAASAQGGAPAPG